MRQHAACATGNRGSRSRGVGVSQFQLSVVAMLNLNFMWLVGLGFYATLRTPRETPELDRGLWVPHGVPRTRHPHHLANN